MKRIGLTGSIGAGKSEAARWLRAEGIPVHDSDAAVREISDLPETLDWVRKVFPNSVEGGKINRSQLALTIFTNDAAKKKLENYMHPRVALDRMKFMDAARAAGASIAVCDIPLLFETELQSEFDETWVVTAPDDVRLARVLSRPGMTDAIFSATNAAQMPQEDKIKCATHVIDNSGTTQELHERLSWLIGQK